MVFKNKLIKVVIIGSSLSGLFIASQSYAATPPPRAAVPQRGVDPEVFKQYYGQFYREEFPKYSVTSRLFGSASEQAAKKAAERAQQAAEIARLRGYGRAVGGAATYPLRQPVPRSTTITDIGWGDTLEAESLKERAQQQRLEQAYIKSFEEPARKALGYSGDYPAVQAKAAQLASEALKKDQAAQAASRMSFFKKLMTYANPGTVPATAQMSPQAAPKVSSAAAKRLKKEGISVEDAVAAEARKKYWNNQSWLARHGIIFSGPARQKAYEAADEAAARARNAVRGSWLPQFSMPKFNAPKINAPSPSTSEYNYLGLE